MKSRIFTWITTITLFTALAMPIRPAAQEKSTAQEHRTDVRYRVTDLGPVGGTPGQPYGISNDGLVVGAAAASATIMHAVLWYNTLKNDIGAHGLGGPNSAASTHLAGSWVRPRLQLQIRKTFAGLTPTDFPHSLHASPSCGNSAR